MKNENLKVLAWDKAIKSFVPQEYICITGDGEIQNNSTENCFYDPKNWVILRFTGVQDIHKKDIYEGFLINQTLKSFRVPPSTYEVIWKDAGFSLIDAKRNGDDFGVFTRNFPLYSDCYEIVGNIYES